jgi:hypothetical protein
MEIGELSMVETTLHVLRCQALVTVCPLSGHDNLVNCTDYKLTYSNSTWDEQGAQRCLFLCVCEVLKETNN